MEFEIRALADSGDDGEESAAVSLRRAEAVIKFLTNLGTPTWRLRAKGQGAVTAAPPQKGKIVFVRTR